MKVAMMVEDRETAFLFLDRENAHEACQEYELVLEGVFFEDIQSEEQCTWFECEGNVLKVVPHDPEAFEKVSDKQWPIPSPVLVLDMKEYLEMYRDGGE